MFCKTFITFQQTCMMCPRKGKKTPVGTKSDSVFTPTCGRPLGKETAKRPFLGVLYKALLYSVLEESKNRAQRRDENTAPRI